jgi:hypothetical protein
VSSDPNIRPLTLAAPDRLLDVVVRVATVTAVAITAELELSSSAHTAALEQGWFHLGPLSAGVGAGRFEGDGTVRVDVSLDPRLVAGLRQVVATPEAVAELMAALGPSSELCSQASWYATAASIAVDADDVPDDIADALVAGSLREGYRTMWASTDDAGGWSIAAHLAEVLERRFDGVRPLEDHPGFRWSLAGADASWTTTAIVDDAASWCVLYSVYDRDYEEHLRDALIERTGQLSSALLFGSWHITDHPLQVRFRSAIELPDRTAATSLLDQLVTRHLDIVDEYASVLA